MAMFSTTQPALPEPPQAYSSEYHNQFNGVLRLFFGRLMATQHVNLSTINIDLDKLPTEADVATLRVGDVYRDTTASNVLKVKV